MENLTFHFKGSLADQHTLNFYEAARFQYAASRLIVKLAQFRQTGRFSQKITNNTNRDILLRSQRDGSFDIGLLMPLAQVAQEAFITTPISTLMTYVFERVFGKTSNEDVANALNTQRAVVETIGKIDDNNTELMGRALDLIQRDQEIKDTLHAENRELLERRIAELERDRDLTGNRDQLARIDGVREQKLISMAAPLISEMATTLRRSADSLEIMAGGAEQRRILYLNKEMAHEIELARVDKDITPLLVDIVQYNKETGWGKLRTKISNHPLSFSVPSDRKSSMQKQLLDAMDANETYIQTYIVRDKANEPIRFIIVGILELPDEL